MYPSTNTDLDSTRAAADLPSRDHTRTLPMAVPLTNRTVGTSAWPKLRAAEPSAFASHLLCDSSAFASPLFVRLLRWSHRKARTCDGPAPMSKSYSVYTVGEE